MEALNESLFKALSSYKRVPMMFSSAVDMPPGEFFGLFKVEHLSCTSAGEVNVSDIQGTGQMTMPAVSQMLNNLERKGLIVRGISSADRRKITVSLTEDGKEYLRTAKKHADMILSEAVATFGEERTRQLIELSTQFSGVLEAAQRKVCERIKNAQNIDGTSERMD